MAHPSYLDVQAGRAQPRPSNVIPADQLALRRLDRETERLITVTEHPPEREDSPAMVRFFATCQLQMRQSVYRRVKIRARTFLSPATRWQMDMVWPNLSKMDTDDGLRCIMHAAELPSYQRSLPALNLRAAAVVFRYLRAAERRAGFLQAAE